MEQTPSIGRIVHYVPYMGAPANSHYAAVITHVWSDTCVNLEVFPKGIGDDENNAGLRMSVLFDETGQNGWTWHWPERV